MICYNCYKVLAPPFAHTLEITDSLRTTILCVGCDDALLFKKKRKLYWMWFYALSGLPSDMWAVVQQRLEEEENGFGL
jgi:RNase P subunit RPR2